MGRHRTPAEKAAFRDRALALRRSGVPRRTITAELGISDKLLTQLLGDEPVHPRNRRPRAKNDLRQLAVEMRLVGRTYDNIARELGVSKGSLSLWLRDLAGGPPARGGDPAHMKRMSDAYWSRVLAEREVERQAVKAAAAQEMGSLSRRDLHVAAIAAYWAEGAKDKPYARREQVTFINSDEGMIRLWLAYLDDIDFPREHRRYALSIHDSADIAAATRSWAAVVGLDPASFGRPSLKRHSLPTSRKNVDELYRGCLVVRLVQCRELYQRIDGAWQGLVAGLAR